MGKLRIRVSIFIVTVILIIISVSAEAGGAFDDTANGNWNDGATWGNTSPGVEGIDYPGASDDVTIDSHTVTLTADAAGNNITIASGGTLTAQNYTLTVSGNWDSSTGTWAANTSTVNLTGTGTLSQTVSTPWSHGFNNLSLAAEGQTTILTSSTLWVKKLTVGSGTLTDSPGSCSLYLQGNGDVFVDGGATITVNSFNYRVSNATQNVVGRNYSGINTLNFYGVGGASGTNTYNMQGNITATTIRIYTNNSSGNVRTNVLNTNNYNITASGLQIGQNGYPYNYGSLDAGSANIDINGNVTIYASDANNANEIIAGSSTWTVSGDWTNKDTFTAGTSTVILDGTNQTITGSSTFYNLSKTVTSAATLTFGASSTTTITGTATLQGASGQLLSLRSSTPGTKWNFTLNSGAAKSISYIDVQDSDASTSDSSLKPVSPSYSSSSGNNIQWFAYQPDAMIKLSAEADGSYLTDNTYETTATVQTKFGGAISGSAAAYSVKFANDSAETDSLVITGTGDASGFTVQYLDDTSTDRTTAVTGSGYTISSLASGASKVWTLNVTPAGSPSPVAGGASYNVFVTATSSNDSGAMDQVKGATISSSANLTLVKSVDKATADPVEDLTYSVTATNASGLTDASGIILTDAIPSYTGFKVGSATFDAGTSTLAAAISYSNDNGSTWTYTPSSEACSAPAGYDYCVTNIKWTMTGDMPSNTNFITEFVARVQ